MSLIFKIREEEITDVLQRFKKISFSKNKISKEDRNFYNAFQWKMMGIHEENRPEINEWNIAYIAAREYVLEQKVEEFQNYLDSRKN